MTLPKVIENTSECWRLLETRNVFDGGRHLKVNRQCVRLPSAQVVDDYYQVELPSFSVVYALTEKSEVVVLRQYKHGVGRVCLTLPGGQVETGEEPEFAARRELLEETGFGGGRWTAAEPLILHGNQKIATAYIYVAESVFQIADAASGDLEEASVELIHRSLFARAVLSGEVPITSHVAATGLASSILDARVTRAEGQGKRGLNRSAG